ncbi:MAG: TatD family deoxyribonuclease [Bryobacterales bacterium]|nr:TatD family deoxyribonuclease [Bryobacterales bacterium]
MEVVDSHCHLDDAQFNEDRATVIERARKAGLKYLLAIGTGEGPPVLDVAVKLAEEYPFVYATAGVHPNDAPKVDDHTIEDLGRLLRHPKVKAMGEIGLDYHWGVPRDVQIPLFERQLQLAKQFAKPVIIHTRDAWEDTLAVLRSQWTDTDIPCVLHCFTGDADLARECLDLGFYLAFGGVATYPKAAEVREAARITPIERLLLETDCPYLAPAPHRGKRNEPAFVLNTAQTLAEVRGVTVEHLAGQTTKNFERVFAIEGAADPSGSGSYT